MTYLREEWVEAFEDGCVAEEWDDIGIQETGGPLARVFVEPYTNAKFDQDEAALRTSIAAAGQQFGAAWDTEQMKAVIDGYIGAYKDWEEIGEEYRLENYDHVAPSHLVDLAIIGRDTIPEDGSVIVVDRDDDMSDGRVFLYNKVK